MTELTFLTMVIATLSVILLVVLFLILVPNIDIFSDEMKSCKGDCLESCAEPHQHYGVGDEYCEEEFSPGLVCCFEE